MMEAAGFSACPADADESARRAATVILRKKGGRGAVREFIELVLSSPPTTRSKRRS